MKRYIDKDALVAEIKKLIKKNELYLDDNVSDAVRFQKTGAYSVLNDLLHFLDILKVKEVDFHKELLSFYRHTNDSGSEIALAKYFFELGLKVRTDKELIEEIYSHIDSIKNTADRMTSGNFMHNRAAIKFSANTIAKVLELIGLKAQKGEEL